jgi:glutamate synthase (NADPH/NADH) small chain
MYGIPNMKLDKQEVVLRRIKLLEDEGIKFICNANVGENVEAQMLLKDFDAIVICTGATQPRDLPIEGVRSRACTSRWSSSPPTPRRCSTAATAPINAKGKDVIVIGGGDTGTDCVGTADAPRLQESGADRNLPKPPTERAATIPGRNGPRSTSSTTVRRRRPPVSAAIRASI